MIPDVNAVVRTYLLTTDVMDLVDHVYCPRAPENATLPYITLFTRGGRSTPYIPPITNPSVQIDCWADDSIGAREIYRAVYEALQGLQNEAVDGDVILSAIEEVQGQDLVDIDIPGRFRVLSFWEIMVK